MKKKPKPLKMWILLPPSGALDSYWLCSTRKEALARRDFFVGSGETPYQIARVEIRVMKP